MDFEENNQSLTLLGRKSVWFLLVAATALMPVAAPFIVAPKGISHISQYSAFHVVHWGILTACYVAFMSRVLKR